MLQLPRTDWDHLSVWIFKRRFVHICITSAWKTIYCCSAEPSLSPLSSGGCFEWSLDVLNILHWFTWLSLFVADNAGSDICMNYWCQYIAIAFVLTVLRVCVARHKRGAEDVTVMSSWLSQLKLFLTESRCYNLLSQRFMRKRPDTQHYWVALWEV